MADNSSKFIYDSNFNQEAAFTRVKFGYDLGILETELNEMQILQEESRKSLTRRLVPSGFIELTKKEFSGAPIIYNPSTNAATLFNNVAIAPARVMIDGSEVTLEGNFSINGYDNYILVDLGEAPDTGTREDLVYLEVWYEVLTGQDKIQEWGYTKGTSLGNPMVDSRVATETSRRVALRWNIKVANDVNFSKFPDGFGYTNVNTLSPIMGSASGQLGYNFNPNLVYANAFNDMFKNCSFYKDANLWIAGRHNYTFKSSSLFGNYIFALPMFRVKRRNKTAYSITNFNGSNPYILPTGAASSATYGDINNNVRPDDLRYDYIMEQDLIDLRRSISVKEFNSEYYLSKGMKQLFTGRLQTKDTNQMRRAQFGKIKVDYTEDSNVILAATFNDRSVNQIDLPSIYSTGVSIDGVMPAFRDSLGGYGMYIDGSGAVKYGASGISNSACTIDCYIQPYWNGYDPNVNQTLFSLKDINGNPIFVLEKKGSALIWSQYTDVINDTTGGVINQVIVDLTTHLMFAKNIYHLRLSWSNQILINKSFIYLNGNLVGEGMYTGSVLSPALFEVGKVESVADQMGVVLEDLVIYKCSFEQNVQTGTYVYTSNNFWPGLPADVINGNALLYQSFNSAIANFEDNGCIQKNTITEVITDVPGSGLFILNTPYGKIINGTPTVYVMNGDADNDYRMDVVSGTWNITNPASLVFSADTSLSKVIMQYDLVIQPGYGGFDLPNEMLAAAIVKADGSLRAVSFARKNTTDLRQVKFDNPNRVSGAIDTAYDLSTNRQQDQCYARILNYNKSGNGTNEYEIPLHLYGYEIIGIINVVGRKMVQCTRIPDNGSVAGKYVIILKDNILIGDVLQLKLALGGMTFDYETQTKSLVSNIHKTVMLEVTADGLTSDFVIPCFDDTNPNGGIIKSVFAYTDNLFEDITNKMTVTSQTSYNTCYVDSQIFPSLPERDSSGNLTGRITNQLVTFTVDPTSFGTPFLHVTFPFKPAQGQKLIIPVLASYQPTADEVLSVWYNYVPYQGILSNNQKKLHKISDWKYFITTLSSGSSPTIINEPEIYSLNNIINRLPGGNSFSYIVDGQNIIFDNMKVTFADTNKNDINTQFVFVHDVAYSAQQGSALNTAFCELDTDLLISRITSGFQDEKIISSISGLKTYFPDTVNDITKYTGACCLVMDENGEMLLFVIGNLNNNNINSTPSKTNILLPTYGDVFGIPGRPTAVQQY